MEFGKEINSIIDNLCNKLGVTVDLLLPELCKYQLFSSIGGLVVCILLLIICFIVFSIAYNIWKKLEHEDDCCLAFMLVSLIGSMLSIGFELFYIYKVIIWYNAPIGAAADYIITRLTYSR